MLVGAPKRVLSRHPSRGELIGLISWRANTMSANLDFWCHSLYGRCQGLGLGHIRLSFNKFFPPPYISHSASSAYTLPTISIDRYDHWSARGWDNVNPNQLPNYMPSKGPWATQQRQKTLCTRSNAGIKPQLHYLA